MGGQKTETTLSDSCATHHFVHDRSSFKSYGPVSKETVQAAADNSPLLSKGLLWLSLQCGTYVVAYHAPHVGIEMLAVNQLTKPFNVIF